MRSDLDPSGLVGKLRPPVIFFALYLTPMLIPAVPGHWENLNPGAGGQIQDIVLDENTPGRIFYCSDVDGIYRSEDYGRTWLNTQMTSSCSDALTVAIEPGNADRVYLGMDLGVDRSDDGGLTWQRMRGGGIENDPIMTLVVDPDDPTRLYGTPSWRFRWEDSDARRNGVRGIYRSVDRGETWTYQPYEAATGRRDTFSLALRPGATRTVIVSGLAGLYRSDDGGDTWSRLPDPAGTDGSSRGVVFSPDGAILYATFGLDGGTHLYAARVADLGEVTGWIDLFEVSPGLRKGLYSMPEMDARSTSGRHDLLIAAPDNAPFGLVELQVEWPEASGVPTVEWRQIMSWNPSSEYGQDHAVAASADVGWELYWTRPLVHKYTPPSWGENQRTLWVAKDQVLFSADSLDAAFPNNWEQQYCDLVTVGEGYRTYRTRGANCMVLFDGNGYGAYEIMSAGDNGVLESWDNGWSWTIDQRPRTTQGSRSNASAFVTTVDPVIALAHVGTGFGGAAYDGYLYAKELTREGPGDAWKLVGGGPGEIAGLPFHKYNPIVPDPANPGRVYVAAVLKILSYDPWQSIDGALYVTDDIEAVLAGTGSFREVGAGSDRPILLSDQNQGVGIDPDDSNRLWLADQGMLWEAVRSGQDYTWRKIRSAESVTVMSVGDETWLAVSIGSVLGISRDGGGTWTVAFTVADALALHRPEWYENEKVQIKGLVSSGPDVFFSVNVGGRRNKSLGIFRITFNAEGESVLSDFSGDLPFRRIMSNRVVEKPNGRNLYAATWGGGLWRRAIPQSGEDWRRRHWGETFADEPDSDLEADPDADGLRNRSERVFGSDPAVHDPDAARIFRLKRNPASADQVESWIAEWTQSPAVDADHVVLEVSEDLSTWTPVDAAAANVTWTLETLPDWRVRHRVRLTGFSDGASGVFARLSLLEDE